MLAARLCLPSLFAAVQIQQPSEPPENGKAKGLELSESWMKSGLQTQEQSHDSQQRRTSFTCSGDMGLLDCKVLVLP